MSQTQLHQTPNDTHNEIEAMFDNEDVAQIANEQLEQQSLDAIKSKSVSGALSYFLRTGVLLAIGLIAQGILGAYLSPSDFGIFGYVSQFMGIFVFFADFGLAAALIQKKTEPTDIDYRTAFTFQQGLSWAIFAAFMILSATGIVQEKTGSVGTGLLFALGLSFPLATLKTIPSLQLERKLDFNKVVVPQIFEQLVYNGVLIFFALSHMGVQSYTYAILARSIIGVIVMYFIQPWLPRLGWNKESFKSLFGYGLKFQLNDFLAWIKDNIFYLLLARYIPLSEFGYIQWAKNWSMYPYNLTVQNVMAITFPTYARLQKQQDALAKAIEKTIFFITLTIFPILVGMSIFVVPLVHLIGKYQKWEPAVLSLILFSLSIGWSAISSPLTNMLSATGKINVVTKLMIMWTVLTWVLTPILMHFFGFNGVAIAAFLISFTSIVPLLEVKKIIHIDFWENVWRQTLASLVMGVVGAVFLPLWSQSFMMMLLGMIVVSAVYGVVMLVCGKEKLFSEIKSLRKKSEGVV